MLKTERSLAIHRKSLQFRVYHMYCVPFLPLTLTSASDLLSLSVLSVSYNHRSLTIKVHFPLSRQR